MNLLRLFKKGKETPLDRIKAKFNFLIVDFGFKLIKTERNTFYIAEYLAIYRNPKSKIQLEICADQNWFHCEIRRIINDEPAKYNDEENCIGFEDLAVLESNNEYDHLEYFISSNGFEEVLENTAGLLERYKDFLTTDQWIDTKKIEHLKDEESEKKFGFKRSSYKNSPTFYTELKKKAIKLLTENGFKLILDSELLPPYYHESMTESITFSKGYETIEVSQNDWRDTYFIYTIKHNGETVYQIDLSTYSDVNKAIDITVEKIKEII